MKRNLSTFGDRFVLFLLLMLAIGPDALGLWMLSETVRSRSAFEAASITSFVRLGAHLAFCASAQLVIRLCSLHQALSVRVPAP